MGARFASAVLQSMQSVLQNYIPALIEIFQSLLPIYVTVLWAALFTLGLVGVMTRRNVIIVLMSIELMLNAVNINLIAFSHQLQNAVGLGIILAFYRNKETVNIDEMNLLRW